MLAGWVGGLAVLGAAFGAVGQSAEEVVALSEDLEAAMLALASDAEIVEMYFAFAMGFLGPIAAGYTVQALLRLRTEESEGRLEPLLATALPRWRWLAGHVALAAGGTIVALTAMGASAAMTYGLMTGHWALGTEGLLGGALLQVPAALVLGGIVLVAVAAVPRQASAVGWAVFAVSVLMGQIGALLSLPQTVLNLSPFTHVAGLARDVDLLTVVVLMTLTMGMTGLGALRFRRRDIAGGI